MCNAEYVAAVYSEIRADEVASEVPHSYTTARTLLSILRLSQALARLRFADHVDQVSLQCVTQFTYQCILYMYLQQLQYTLFTVPSCADKCTGAPRVLHSVLVIDILPESLIPCHVMLCGRQM